MSIYRQNDGLKAGKLGFETVTPVGPRHDPPTAADVRPPGANATEPAIPAPPSIWTDKRRAVPVEHLLKDTSLWARSLPSHLYPQALMEKYPRVANLAAACWKEPASFHACVADLVVVTERRGPRQGFPADVLAELVNLQSYNLLNRYAPLLAQERAQQNDDTGSMA